MFITALVVGFVLNLIVPSIPLAAAFALGAALGPTDAAAVAAMGKDVKLTDRQKSLLSGEALFNDASGVVAFEFAIAAAITGTFSLANATATFLFDFVGGVVVGLVLAAIVMFVLGRVRALGLENAHGVSAVRSGHAVFRVPHRRALRRERHFGRGRGRVVHEVLPELAYHRIVSLRRGQRKRVGAYRIRD